MFYSGTLLRNIAQGTASQIALRKYSKEVREEPRYIEVFAEKKKVFEHQNITANHKKQTSQFKDLMLFFVREDAGVWAY